MYRVIIYNGNERTVIHEPTVDPDDAHLYECTLVEGSSGEIDSLSFTILPNNPGYEKLFSYTTFVEVVDLSGKTDATEFSGRVLSVAPQMEESGLVYKSVVCEDRLGYLCDSIQPYTPKATYTVREFLELLLANHNAQVEDYKKIYVGEVSFETSSGNVTKGLNYQTTWEAIKDKLLGLGGEIQLYTLGGLLYLDYVAELGTTGEQKIEIAKNLRTLEQDKSPTDIITRLIPLGDYKDEQEEDAEEFERINIEPVNNGKNYLDDEAAQAVYGIIAGTVVWEDVTLPENLLTKGRQWLEDQTIVDTISLTSLDLYAAGIEPDAIERSNYYEIVNPLLGIDKFYRVSKKTINVVDPTDVKFDMGKQNLSLSASLSGAVANAASASDAAAAINANLSKTVTTLIAGNAIIQYLQTEVADIAEAYIDYAEVERLLAGYASIEYLQANYASIAYLQSEYVTANYIETNYIAANSAWVTNLDAWTANINSLLSGSAGVGDLQTIHLTADNVVIDDAVIFDLIAQNAIIGELMAGIIYTDFVKIANNEGQNLYIDGSTIQIFDGCYVRIQIGEDASGDYNMYIWDANGNLLWDALGLTEAGLSGNGAIIKDMNIADDAAIQGYKIDMETLSYCLNEYGGLTMEAAQITIDGNTLDYKLTSMTTEINQIAKALDGIEMEGVVDIQIYYALGDSATEPPEDSEETKSAICGAFLCGELLCGATGTGSVWTLEEPEAGEGEYVWFRHRVEYVDGTVVWTTPTCITSGYMMTHLYSLQTQLEVVQGQISATVTRSDVYQIVNESIEEGIDVNALYPRNYCLLSGGYKSTDDVGTIVDVAVNTGAINESDWHDYYTVHTYDGYMRIRSNNASCTFQVIWGLSPSFAAGETCTISVKCRTNGGSIQFGVYWFYLPANDAAEYAWGYRNVGYLTATGTWQTLTVTVTAYEWENYELSGFMLGFGPLAVYSAVDIESIMLEKGGTAHDWIRALEDYATTSQITVLQDQYAGIVVNLNSIDARVSELTTVVTDDYESLSNKYAELLITIDEIRSSVSDTYQVISDLQTQTETHFSQVEQTAYEISQTVQSVEYTITVIQGDISGIETSITGLGSDINGLESEIDAANSSIVAVRTQVQSNTSKIEQLDSSITLQVSQVRTDLITYIDTALEDYDPTLPRNYALLSGAYKATDDAAKILTCASSYITLTAYDGYIRVYCNRALSSAFSVYWGISPAFSEGTTYTVSVKWRRSGSIGNSNSVTLQGIWYYGTTPNYTTTIGTTTLGTSWQTDVFRWSSTSYTGYSIQGIGFTSPINSGTAIEIEYIMLEEGTEAHEWTRAPEDYATMADVMSFSDKWAEIDITLDAIREEIGEIEGDVAGDFGTFSERIAALELTTSSITSTVESIQVSVEGARASIDVLNGDYSDLKSLLDSVGGSVTSMETRISQVEQTESSISSTVASIQSTLTVTQSDLASTQSDLASVKNDLSSSIAKVESDIETVYSYVDQTASGITSTVAQTETKLTQYIDTETGEVMAQISTTETSLKSQIEQLAGSISLTVSGGALGNTAQIRLSVNGSTTSQSIDLTGVRQAFANDTTAITISAGTITMASGILIITSGQMTLDASGNATFSGNLSAPSGNIGGWTIGTNCLYNGCSSSTSTTNGIYLGTSRIRQYYNGDYVNITTGRVENGNSSGDAATLYSGVLQFTHSDTVLGNHGTGYYAKETSKYGMAINAEYDCKYIGFGRKTSSSATEYTWDYLINYGLSTGSSYIGYAQKHILYGDVRVTGDTYTAAVYIRNSSGADTYYMGSFARNGSPAGVYTNGAFSSENYILAGNVYQSGYMLVVNGSAYATGTFYEGSDLKLKTDVRPVDDALLSTDAGADAVDVLEPIAYRFDRDGSDKKLHFGVSYQNVCDMLETAGIDPEDAAIVSVTEDEDGNATGAVAYSELIGLLLYEIQKIKAQLKEIGG